MKKFLLLVSSVLLLVAFFIGGLYLGQKGKTPNILAPVAKNIQEKARPLDKYTIDNLSQKTFQPSDIKIERELQSTSTAVPNPIFIPHLFTFTAEGKKVSGQINIPTGPAPETGYKTVIMFRGYADPENYTTGTGTRNAAAVFAQNGYLTIAPDFLGYGESDPINPDVMEARFETYITALSLLSSIEANKITTSSEDIATPKIDTENLFIWGHSNGGQVTLTVLEITKKDIPSTLWAPVTKPFPYSVLYYTDESSDRGKFLRKQIAEFEETYDPDLYSLDLYIDRINAPVQLHQGSIDDAVPQDWSDEFAETMEEKEKDITYFVYPGSDHNLRPAWNTVVARDLAFFQKHTKRAAGQ